MLILLYGKNTFDSLARLKELIIKFKKDRDPQGLNTAVVDCEKSAKDVLGQILSAPFLSEKRMVVLKNFLLSKDTVAQDNLLEQFKNKHIPETNIIIFWEGTDTFKLPTAKKLFEILSKEKYSQKFAELSGAALGDWIIDQVKDQGGKISSEATQFLVSHGNKDLWALNSLVEQLVSYSLDREINLSDAQLFLDEKIDDNIFNLIDAITGKQEKQVYKMIQEQYRQGKDAQFIFSMILRQFRIMLELRDLFDKQDKTSSDDLAKKIGVHPYVVKKTLSFTRNYNMEKLKNIYKQLLEMDIQTKTGYGDGKLLLDLLVGKICQ